MAIFDAPLGFFQEVYQQPLWLQLWLTWLMIVNTVSLAFLRHVEGRVTFIVWALNGISMMAAFAVIGWSRGLGIVHVIWWTPLLVWLYHRFRHHPPQGLFRVWLILLVISDGVSLIIDYVDTVRYLSGNV
jgi:hypothetical protein